MIGWFSNMLMQASKAKEEAASLRGELRLARSEQADRWIGTTSILIINIIIIILIIADIIVNTIFMIRQGTQCNVCLDRPRETVLQPCGHVCLCLQCADR